MPSYLNKPQVLLPAAGSLGDGLSPRPTAALLPSCCGSQPRS